MRICLLREQAGGRAVKEEGERGEVRRSANERRELAGRSKERRYGRKVLLECLEEDERALCSSRALLPLPDRDPTCSAPPPSSPNFPFKRPSCSQHHPNPSNTSSLHPSIASPPSSQLLRLPRACASHLAFSSSSIFPTALDQPGQQEKVQTYHVFPSLHHALVNDLFHPSEGQRQRTAPLPFLLPFFPRYLARVPYFASKECTTLYVNSFLHDRISPLAERLRRKRVSELHDEHGFCAL